MFKISAMTRVGLVAVACVAVAAPSALAKAPAEGNAKSLYGYAMSYAPTKITPEPGKPAKVQSWLYGYAMFYAPTKRTPEPAKPAKVQSLYGYAMSYTPTKATGKAAQPVKQSLYGYAMSYTPTKASANADTQADIERMRRIWTDRFESKDTIAKADTQADVDRMQRIWTDRD
jgi:hypothetical protein